VIVRSWNLRPRPGRYDDAIGLVTEGVKLADRHGATDTRLTQAATAGPTTGLVVLTCEFANLTAYGTYLDQMATDAEAQSYTHRIRGAEAPFVYESTAVLAEIDLEVSDGADRHRLAVAYLERLLRSDLGVHLARALDRADPTMADLFGAIDAFLGGLPVAVWPGRAILHEIIEPPLRRWSRVPAAARPAFDSLVRRALDRQRLLAEGGRNPLERWALRRVLPKAGSRADPLAFGALGMTSIARGIAAAPRRAGSLARRLPPIGRA